MNKFKVGDRVTLINGLSIGGNWYKDNLNKTMKIKRVCSYGTTYEVVENPYSFSEAWLSAVSTDRYELHITCNDGKTTNAVYKVNGEIKERKQAVCAPSDTFDFAKGVQTALDRIFPHPAQEEPAQPKAEPIKLYCVKEYKPGEWLTKGKVYEVVDGKVTTDSGYVTTYNNDWLGGIRFQEYFIPLVSRPAKVGEWVLMTDQAFGFTGHHKGEIFKVVETAGSDDVRIDLPKQHGVICMKCEYLVLDGYSPEPEYYNGKVVCVEWVGDCFTVGKVYEVINGRMKANTGVYATPIFKTINDVLAYSGKFIEFKGE